MWKELRPDETAAWAVRVYEAGAPLWQLPFWTAFLNRSGVRTAARTPPMRRFRYLVEEERGRPRAWVCVMEVGVPGYRVALVQDGPVGLAAPVDAGTLEGLCAALRERGYVFVRFSNAADDLATVSSLRATAHGDLLPYFQKAGWELHVPLSADPDDTLAGFTQRTRYAIRRAARESYKVMCTTTEAGLDEVYQMLAETAARKGFRAPPSPSILAALVREADPVGGIRIYQARRPDESLASTIVIATERSTWHYVWGGVDAENLRGWGSPTPLLHWAAMCDATSRGASWYNLGARTPASVEQFKRGFRPTDVAPQDTVSVALRPLATLAWRQVALPALQTLWPSVRGLRHRLVATRTHAG
jgi:hypothetical protein